MAKLKELQKKKRREKRRKRREIKKALEEGERKTLKAMVQLWLDSHPQREQQEILAHSGISEASFVDNILSLIDKGILKLEVTEYENSEMIRVRMFVKDPTTGRWI